MKGGEVVKVKVMEVDLKRQRIALSLRLDDPLPDADTPAPERRRAPPRERPAKPPRAKTPERKPAGGTLADAFARARKR